MAQSQPKAATKPKTAPKPKAATKPKPPITAENKIFDQAVGFVLNDQIEGGYVNDPRDPGGETNFGISKRSYPKVNMKTLTKQGAISIYKRDYWDAAGCDNMPPMIAVAVFDCAVNQGVGIAKRLIQKAARVSVDGAIGPKSLKAINSGNQVDLLVQFNSWRLRRYAFTGNAATYMRGWSKRVLLLQLFCTTELKVA